MRGSDGVFACGRPWILRFAQNDNCVRMRNVVTLAKVGVYTPPPMGSRLHGNDGVVRMGDPLIWFDRLTMSGVVCMRAAWMLYFLPIFDSGRWTRVIGFLGGTGLEGRGLALRFALAGEQVVIGSRQAARAQEAARAVLERGPVEGVSGARNREAAEQADVVFITCPYQAQIGLLEPLADALAGKLVVSTVAPLAFDEGSAGLIGVPEGSAAEQARRLLPESRIAAAFQNVSAVDLWSPHRTLEGDVLVCSDDEEARLQTMELARMIPDLRPVDGGALRTARYVEGITALILNLNRRYKTRAMIRMLGLEPSERH